MGQVSTGVAALGALALSPLLAFAVEPLTTAPFWPSEPAATPEVRLIESDQHLGLDAVGNLAVLEQRNGFVVIDRGGTASDGRRAVRLIRSISGKPVQTVVLGDERGTQVASVTEIRRAWPEARIVSAGGGAGADAARYRLRP